MKSSKKRVELNWAKLVGFNQVRALPAKQAKAVLSAKIGVKGGSGGDGGGGLIITTV